MVVAPLRVTQLVDKVNVLEDINMKKEIDAKQINQKINEAPPKHRAFCSNDMPGIGFECENCDENFTSRKTLEQHLEDHHTKKRKLTGI